MYRKVLVTEGAGYIGSHVPKQWGERGKQVLMLDNLSTGFADAKLFGQLTVGDTGDSALLDRLIDERKGETVPHFGAKTIVPESVADPLKYYSDSTAAILSLRKCCQRHKVRHVIFPRQTRSMDYWRQEELQPPALRSPSILMAHKNC